MLFVLVKDMPTTQIWLTDYDMEKVEAIRKVLARQRNPDHVEEEDMEKYVNEGIVPRVRRPKLNNTYVVRAALEYYYFSGCGGEDVR